MIRRSRRQWNWSGNWSDRRENRPPLNINNVPLGIGTWKIKHAKKAFRLVRKFAGFASAAAEQVYAQYRAGNAAHLAIANDPPFVTSTGKINVGNRRQKRKVVFVPDVPMAGANKRRGNRSGYSGIKAVPRFQRPLAPSKVDLYGIRHEREIWGENIMKDCNYTGFMAHVPKVMAYDAGVAWIRWFMRKHYKMEYSSHLDDIYKSWSATAAGNPPGAPRIIRFYYTDTGNNIQSTNPAQYMLAEYDLAALLPVKPTIKSFAEWFANNIVFNTIWGPNGQGVLAPDGTKNLTLSHYSIFENVYQPTSMVILESQLYPIHNQIIRVYAKSCYTIQNQTVADSGSADAAHSTDRIDVNPIHGKLFYFNGLMPELSRAVDSERYNALIDADLAMSDNNGAGDGVLVPKDNPTLGWRAPPSPQVFANCRGVANVRINPGQMRKGIVRFNFTGTITKLLDICNSFTTYSVGPNVIKTDVHSINNLNRRFGSCVLFALEKVMRTGNSKDVQVAWHLDRYSGALILSNRATPMKRIYTQEPGGTDWINDPV